MARDTLLPRYPSLRPGDLSVTIVEGSERVVGTARPEHSSYVQRFLERRGVSLRLGARVARVEDKRLMLADGAVLEGFTILWTAGVCPPDWVRALPLQHTPDGRVRVDSTLRALDPAGHPVEGVYVIGDCAAALRADGRFQPALSQTAIAMGTYVGARLIDQARGRTSGRFEFADVGYIISLGKHSSVLDLFGIPLSGKLAWLMWAAAYLIKMVGFRKQIEVGIDHLTHLFFEHDTSQIMNRRQVLSDQELNLSLGTPEPDAAEAEAAPPAPTATHRA